MNIVLKGAPRSTQTIYKLTSRGRFASMYMSALGKKLKKSYIEQAKEQWILPPLEGDIELSIKIYFNTKRKADWDNFHKLSMDSLTGIVWVDDSQIQVAHVYKYYDKANPRLEITIL